LGYEVGAGSMVGLPGQDDFSLAKDILFTYELDADMIGIGPFIPHPETPLKNAVAGTLEKTLKMVALTDSSCLMLTYQPPQLWAVSTHRQANGTKVWSECYHA